MTRTLATILAAGAAASASAQTRPVASAARIITRSAGDDVGPASVIYEQPTDWSKGIYAQDFPDFPSFSFYAFDEFRLERDDVLLRSFVPGIEQGDSTTNEYTVAQVWTDIPDRGGVLVAESRNRGENVDLVHEWGTVRLSAGVRYYFTAWVRREYQKGGIWTWAATRTITGRQMQIWNPGGAWGGTYSHDGSNFWGVEYDLAFRLERSEPPPPPPPPECYADCDRNNVLDIRDFFCFQAEFGRQSQYADCDRNSRHDIRDFFCFQALFAAGCP